MTEILFNPLKYRQNFGLFRYITFHWYNFARLYLTRQILEKLQMKSFQKVTKWMMKHTISHLDCINTPAQSNDSHARISQSFGYICANSHTRTRH